MPAPIRSRLNAPCIFIALFHLGDAVFLEEGILLSYDTLHERREFLVIHEGGNQAGLLVRFLNSSRAWRSIEAGVPVPHF
jgi:hypothetical protein